MLKVVLDTNVFLSGILFGGNPREIVRAWLAKQFILCISPELKAEILNKLRLKFQVSNLVIDYVADALDHNSEKYIPRKKVNLCRDHLASACRNHKRVVNKVDLNLLSRSSSNGGRPQQRAAAVHVHHRDAG